PENEIQQVKTLYEAEVANVDIALKELFDFLRLNGLFENTLIIFSADHGEEFFEHGGFEHGHTLYDELVHMPLIISGDGFPPGIQIETPVGNTDIFPSILDFIGMPIPDGLEGVPLQSVIKGVIPEDRPIYGEGVTRGTHKKFIIQWPYKCVFDYVTRTATLFDLEIDPDELTDISEDNKELALILVAKMAETMLPDQTAFHLWVTVSHHESPKRFSGTLKIPGGIESVEGFLLTDDDRYSIDSDTISFDFSSLNNIQGLYRHLVIIPAEGAETLEASLLVDGAVDAKRFYPYGTNVPEPSGSAMVSIDDYPLGPELPPALDTIPAACFIWGVRGYERQDVAIMHDPETEEQLRALGYLGGNL
ncbi:MAG TPA: hypothetical protein ENN67_07890, partial [Firmicutes bacterium]|nr:hypothetical protein [Bacillota bacterium]